MSQATIVRDGEAARSLVDPVRRGILERLAEPDSASGVARRIGIKRQVANYHIRELERVGLLRQVGERRKGNCTERIVQATAAMYLISPAILGGLGADPQRIQDHASGSYLAALAAQAIAELAAMRERPDAGGKPPAAFSLHAYVKFASQSDLHAFTRALNETLASLASRYDSGANADGHLFRLILGVYPAADDAPGMSACQADLVHPDRAQPV